MNAATSTQQTATPQAIPSTTAIATATATAAEPSLEEQTAALIAAAEDGTLETTTAETPAEGEAKPEPTKLDLAAETLRKARKIAKSRREAVARADREKLRADQFAQKLEQEQKEGAEARAEREAFRKDPLGAIRKAGVTARTLAEKAIEEGTPEARMAAIEAKHAADLERVRAELREELETTLKKREDAVQARQQRDNFFAHVTAESHPTLARLDQDVVLTIAQKEFVKAKANGYNPTDKQVLDWCESLLSAPRSASAGTSAAQTNPGPTVAKPVAKPSPASRTVTADLAGKRYTAPADIENMSLSDQSAALVKMLEDAERQGS